MNGCQFTNSESDVRTTDSAHHGGKSGCITMGDVGVNAEKRVCEGV